MTDIKSLDIDLVTRWEKCKPHHPIAQKLAKMIGEIDYNHNSDALGLKFGGDGDNGESLCYALSEIFERELIPEILIKDPD